MLRALAKRLGGVSVADAMAQEAAADQRQRIALLRRLRAEIRALEKEVVEREIHGWRLAAEGSRDKIARLRWEVDRLARGA